jgi:pilus assembly protein CpaB
MNVRFLLVAILLAGLSAALVYAKISAKGGSSSTSSKAGEQSVVVARSVIRERTTITRDMLEVKNVPVSAVTAGSLGKIEDAVGKVTKFPIDVNEQVTSTSVIDTSRPLTDAQLSYVIPAGRRALSIQASQVGNAGGLILPGDWVDIVWTCCQEGSVVTKTILRNIQVAAVAQEIVPSGPVAGNTTPNASTTATNPVAAGSQKPTPDASTVTLLLTPTEAQQVFLAEQNGKLRLAERGVGDTDLANVGTTTFPQLLPPEDVAGLPEQLKPNGYKRQ